MKILTLLLLVAATASMDLDQIPCADTETITCVKSGFAQPEDAASESPGRNPDPEKSVTQAPDAGSADSVEQLVREIHSELDLLESRLIQLDPGPSRTRARDKIRVIRSQLSDMEERAENARQLQVAREINQQIGANHGMVIGIDSPLGQKLMALEGLLSRIEAEYQEDAMKSVDLSGSKKGASTTER